ncbi:biopolymer transporter ExbD [Desulfonema ishimotonii]|uniref:Biopolymer transporter ExbD n=1 Tax=Desulfonema ishimotonii TaxID=45657 RepID=A0A401FZF5_9BACT|nr:biopolymer transporter ExbD [Desulfonema ishimotonii]
MNRVRISRQRRSKGAEINMAPLLDMVFILLIFFIVTTSFVKESGVEIQRPTAKSAMPREKVHLMVEVTQTGDLFIEGKSIDIRSLRARMKRFIVETPGGSVVIVADRQSSTGTVIRVLDESRLAGVENISVSARKPE